MTRFEDALIWAKDQVDRGNITADQANVEIIRMMGVREINGRISRETRRSLMDAVKKGELGRIAKTTYSPEFFFHPNSEWRAKEMKDRITKQSFKSILKVIGRQLEE